LQKAMTQLQSAWLHLSVRPDWKDNGSSLQGLTLQALLQPADSLYDIYNGMIEKNEVSYINPNRCLSRRQELMGLKPEK